MNSRNKTQFGRGTGVYACAVCKRNTRQTGGDNDSLGLCEECYEVAGLENEISDYGLTGAELEKAKAEIDRLNAQCRAKGGQIAGPAIAIAEPVAPPKSKE